MLFLLYEINLPINIFLIDLKAEGMLDWRITK